MANNDPGDRSVDIYHADLGDDITGGQAEFDDDGGAHVTVHGQGWHKSWDVDSDGEVGGGHDSIHTDQGREVVDEW